jgi:tRNA A-37 threonylcarbamoyl transferase component Bud32
MPPDPLTGATIAGFRVGRLLGEGAMGTVYRAEDAGGHRVAIKLLPPKLAGDERFRRRFLRELQIAASLDHPNVVRTVAFGEADGALYLVMEHVDGRDLRAMLRDEGPLAPEQTLDVVSQVAEALDAAHAKGLVHRDVKPGNILVSTDDGRVRARVCDFGLARHVSSPSSLTGETGFVGTIDYVPPEQIEGNSIDGRADVYSLGCVLFECLAGERPFDRDSDLSVVFAHLNEPPPRVTDLRTDLPEAFDAVIATALAKAPGDRYSTCGELAAAARAALRGKVVARRRPRRRLAAAALALALAVSVAGLWLTTRGGPASSGVLITASSIDGLPLGLEHPAYKRRLGIGWREDVFSAPGWPVLIYFGKKLSIYFNPGTQKAQEITTWNRDFRTAKGIGPCSTIVDLKKAYGPAVKPSPYNTIRGKVFAYTVGNLIFAANGPPGHPSKRVTAVALYSPPAIGAKPLAFASFVVENESSCS